jgi:hypothetical protein
MKSISFILPYEHETYLTDKIFYLCTQMEDIVVMYLKCILTDGITSFLYANELNPDFVIETRDKPILMELGTKKTTLKQLKKSNIDFRYGLLITSGVNKPILNENCIQIPLSWFLLL